MTEDATQFHNDVSKERLGELIGYLRPDRELYTGRKFFEILFEYGGTERVLSFCEKAARALSDKGELDIYFDFDDVEKEAFRRARLNMVTRRAFLGVGAVGFSGVVFGATGLAGLTRQARNILSSKLHATSDDPIEATEDFVHKQLYPIAELAIGGALINEAYDKRIEIKLEQIADAVTELDLKLRKDKEHANQGRS